MELGTYRAFDLCLSVVKAGTQQRSRESTSAIARKTEQHGGTLVRFWSLYAFRHTRVVQLTRQCCFRHWSGTELGFANDKNPCLLCVSEGLLLIRDSFLRFLMGTCSAGSPLADRCGGLAHDSPCGGLGVRSVRKYYCSLFGGSIACSTKFCGTDSSLRNL